MVGGDSGRALLDDEGEVIGITTAASVGRATTQAYAITIDHAMAVVEQILAGDEFDGVELGYPAFLGVAITDSRAAASVPGRSSAQAFDAEGAVLGRVYDDTPAASVGLEAGDTITAVDGGALTSGDDLSAAISGHEPGDAVTLTWTSTDGSSHSATVTLTEGPVS